MGKKTLFVSDLHIGINTESNWYQSEIHEKALKSFLRYIQKHGDEIMDVVVLGDWFDLWSYGSIETTPGIIKILERNQNLFTKQSDKSGDFISAMEAIQGHFRFVNGDHDMTVELKELNRWLRDRSDVEIYPGFGDNIQKSALGNTFYRGKEGKIWAEHGHLYDLLNKPALMAENPYKPLPIGYYIARVEADYSLKKIDSLHKPNVSHLKGAGNPCYRNLRIGFKEIAEQVVSEIKKGKEPNIAKIVLDMMLRFNVTKKLEFNLKGIGGKHAAFETVENFFPGLLNTKNFYEDLREAEVNFTGLGCFVRRHFRENRNSRVVLMGHTHDPRMVISHIGEDRMYINTGYFCPSLHDMRENLVYPSFIELADHGDGQLIATEKKIVDYIAGEIEDGTRATLDL